MKEGTLFKDWGTFRKPMDAHGIQLSFANHLEYSLAKDQHTAVPRDLFQALALAARDRMMERWVRTHQVYYQGDVKRVYFLSAEYLMGRALTNNLINLGIYEESRKAMADLGVDVEELAEEEPDAALGNGGLGRLAACFLDSLAVHEIPSMGYGIRYEFGIFDQVIRRLGQVEQPEEWLKHGNPWEVARPERSCTVRFYGRTRETALPDGTTQVDWIDTEDLIGLPYDTPIDGYGNDTVNTLRLWSARSSREFDLGYFQDGNYMKAVEQKYSSESISKVLYPADNNIAGKKLRLKQEYFFVACSIQDIVRRFCSTHDGFDAFADKVAIQLNDTHPTLAIPELMRILIDEHRMAWERAWELTQTTCAYTNHTLLAEALEKWPVSIFERLLPRHMQIIYEINRRFLRDVAVAYPGDMDRLRRMSIIEEEPERRVRMAHLAVVGSHSTNGVAELHTRLLKERVMNDFAALYPERFSAKTNGITPRRWLLVANPALHALIAERIGEGFVTDMNLLRRLEPLAADGALQQQWAAVKHANKERLALVAREIAGVVVDPESIFDVHVKRIHEYKRQLLNILHVVYLWLRLKEEPDFSIHPRTFFFGGKAAPGYFMAKQVIRLICHVAEMINRDPRTGGQLKVVFLPNYRVSLAERVIPAADVSQHISTAGYEASGTSNMKFAVNGALTVGTLDGANIEIMEEVGADNIFIFGMTADEVEARRAGYDPRALCAADPRLAETLDLVRRGFFSPEEPDTFHPLLQSLDEDRYMVLGDFHAYHQCQVEVDRTYRDRAAWLKKSILNVARIGKFSSDRAIYEYNRDIWHAEPIHVTRNGQTPTRDPNI